MPRARFTEERGRVLRLSYLIAICALVSCSPQTPDISASFNCRAIHGSEQVLSDQAPPIIILGETHGTKEAPAFTADLLCLSLAQNNRTLLLLEYPVNQSKALQDFMISPDTAESLKTLFESPEWFWNTTFSDGRSSVAMLELIKSVKGFNQNGAPVGIAGFQPVNIKDGDGDMPQQPYDRAMGENITSYVNADKWDKIIVLVGGLHAQRDRVELGDTRFDPVASYIQPDMAINLEFAHDAGESWSCIGAVDENGQYAPNCGSNPSGRYVPDGAALKPVPSISIHTTSGNFDGTFYVGALSASPPAALGIGQ